MNITSILLDLAVISVIDTCVVLCIPLNNIQYINLAVVLVFRVEDHDDLTPIFNSQTEVLTESYGAYYLAELIESQDENMKCIVAEVNEPCYVLVAVQ